MNNLQNECDYYYVYSKAFDSVIAFDGQFDYKMGIERIERRSLCMISRTEPQDYKLCVYTVGV